MKKHCKGMTLILSFIFVACLSMGVAAETTADTNTVADMAQGRNLENTLPLATPSTLTFTSPFVKDSQEKNCVYTVPSKVLSLGVDVSAWQGDINWQKVADAGVEFALIRVVHHNGHTNAMEDDKKYIQNIEGAQAAGIKVGVYIFSQAINEQEARNEAAYLISKISKYSLEMPLVFDFEWEHTTENGERGRLFDANLSKTAATNVCLAFCNYVSSYGYSPMVYANANMLTSRLDADTIEKYADIWMANYTTNTQYQNHFDYWQYSDKGKIDGVPENNAIDCNFAFVDKVYNLPFKDLEVNGWYMKSVAYAYRHKLFNGISATQFGPKENMTRAMMVSVLYRMESSPTVTGGCGFSDLKEDWYKNSVIWAQQNDIVSGESPTVFAPNKHMTREQLATILYRYAKLKGYDTTATNSLSGFSDGKQISEYAIDAVKWAVGSGYINGFEDKTLQCKNGATRAQVAAILQRFCENNQIY